MRHRYEKTVLDNVLRVVTHSMAGMQSIALGIWIKVGGRYECAGNKGISHYLEHLLFKGSRRYSCRRLKESIEGVGGALNGFTSEELTCYLVKMPRQYLYEALDILSDMVLHPLLLTQDVEKERTVILEEIKMYKDLPHSYVNELLDELLWPQQPLGMNIAGTHESVARINRQELRLFKEEFYVPSHMLICAVGNLNHRAFVKRVKAIFCDAVQKPAKSFVPAREAYDKAQLKVLHKETEQTHLALGFHGLKRDHPLRAAQAVLHVILGANMSSRLFNEIREKRGLAYEIGTQVRRFHDTGAFLVHAGIDNAKVQEALRLILRELAEIKDRLVHEGEFQRAKEFYLGQLMLALEDTLDHMLWIGESAVTLDKVYTLHDVIKEVKALKRSDIRQVAQHIFQEGKLNCALIGPLQGKEQDIYNVLRME